jgi:hypothetical protein
MILTNYSVNLVISGLTHLESLHLSRFILFKNTLFYAPALGTWDKILMLDQKEFFDYVGGSGGQHVIRKKKTFL